jgi:hypothetical protein
MCEYWRSRSGLAVQNSNQVFVINPAQSKVPTGFVFDRVFGEASSQEDVFGFAEQRVLSQFLEGYHSTVFAYGMTGSGKTHTMWGNVSQPDQRGLIPRSFEYIFSHLPEGYDCTVSISCLGACLYFYFVLFCFDWFHLFH